MLHTWFMDVVIVVEGEGAARPGEGADGRFSQLPKPVRLEDTVSTQEASPRPGVDESGDSERDFMLRYAG
jgi:hypothetical protein